MAEVMYKVCASQDLKMLQIQFHVCIIVDNLNTLSRTFSTVQDQSHGRQKQEPIRNKHVCTCMHVCMHDMCKHTCIHVCSNCDTIQSNRLIILHQLIMKKMKMKLAMSASGPRLEQR